MPTCIHVLTCLHTPIAHCRLQLEPIPFSHNMKVRFSSLLYLCPFAVIPVPFQLSVLTL